MRPFVIATAVWASLIAAAWAFGGLMSFYTGITSELPKWNGWSYFFFCAKEGAMMCAVLFSLPFAAIVLLIACLKLRWRVKKSQD